MSARDELTDALVAIRFPHGSGLTLLALDGTSAEAIADAVLRSGYRKPRTITTRAEVEALGDGSVVADSAGDVSEKRGGLWCSYETAPMTDARLSKYLPVTVLHEPAARS